MTPSKQDESSFCVWVRLQLESLLFVKSAYLQQQLNAAAGTLTSTGFHLLIRQSAMIDVAYVALCACVTTETECERTRCKAMHKTQKMITQTQNERKTTQLASMTSCSFKPFNSRTRYRSLWTVSCRFKRQNSKQHRVRSRPFSAFAFSRRCDTSAQH